MSMATRRRGWWPLPAGFGGPRAPAGVQVSEYAHGNRHVVRARLPEPDPTPDLSVSYVDGVLRLDLPDRSAAGGRLVHAVRLPPGAKPDTLTARYGDGVLQVTVEVGERVLPGRDIPVRRRGDG
jgi:HSP20 family protein